MGMHEKIAALLRKAERTDNEHERESFMAKAEELLVREGIDRALLDIGGEVKREEITTRVISFGTARGQSRRDLLVLAHQVVLGLEDIEDIVTPDHDAWRADAAKRGKYSKSVPDNLTIVGYASDLEAAEWLISSITIQAVRACESWWRIQLREVHMAAPPASVRSKAKESFMAGFGAKVYHRLQETRRRVVDEVATPGNALALIDRSRQVESEYNRLFPHRQTTNSRRRMSWDAHGAGSRAGANADLGQSRLSGRGAISA